MSNKYRKKPVIIEAFQMTQERRNDSSDWPEWLGKAADGDIDAEGTLQPVADKDSDMLEIVTLEGNHLVTWGDFIIQGVDGEMYPCKESIFHKTYEKAE